jgi:hypothetical protein
MAKRYVMGNRSDGLSDVLIEDEIIASVEKRSQELWVNTETPADLSIPGDPVGDQKMIHEPPDGGAVFRVVVFPPKGGFNLTAEQMIQYHQSIHSVHIPSLEYLRTAKTVTMHKTDTLNYFVVTEGEVWSMSEGRDVLLKAGDAMIQKGCMHGWRNDSDKRCVLMAILIDAKAA